MLKYASIDIETTGLDPNSCDIIEIGVVIDDLGSIKPLDALPAFHCYVVPEEGSAGGGIYRGEAFALSMHPIILRRIGTREKPYLYLRPDEVAKELATFLGAHGLIERCGAKITKRVTVAGKNFASFDRQFLIRLPMFDNLVHMHHRTIDPGSFYVRAEDETVPNLELCWERAFGTKDKVKAHTAVEDAMDVVQLVRQMLLPVAVPAALQAA